MERKRINIVIIRSDHAIDQWVVLGREEVKEESST